MKEIKILDNFLPEEIFRDLQINLTGNKKIPLFISDAVSDNNDPLRGTPGYFQASYHVYEWPDEFSDLWQSRIPAIGHLLEALPVLALKRMKINYLPYTKEIIEHPLHIDYGAPLDHPDYKRREGEKVCIYYLNTCDGYTHFGDGRKVGCVENRACLFDSDMMHGSSTTTNANWRMVINIVYF